MTARRRVDWPPHVRKMIGEELRLTYEAAHAAEDAFKVRVYIAVEQGVTTREIATEVGISQQTVSRYRADGEALYRARHGSE
ncbi:helix-turn-helix domain-containing protein [Streptomyces rubradiris]|uniref:helix-turn-helix domain-containing protein n=1 Tax=Streptomyces rubradiris TaxID=285531 RepID=UPI0036ED434D